jgi:UTP:GlnB (protein PII) uridylyltransferase
MNKLIEPEHPETKKYLQIFQENQNVIYSENQPESLEKRLQCYQKLFSIVFQEIKHLCREQIVDKKYSLTVTSQYSHWMIAWLHFTWIHVLKESEMIRQVMDLDYREKSKYLSNIRPTKLAQIANLNAFLDKLDLNPEMVGSSEKLYYEKSKLEMLAEIQKLEKDLSDASLVIDGIKDFRVNQHDLLDNFVFFLRGSISRQELTFASDIDFGYCVDNTMDDVLSYKLLQEIIIRFEECLNSLPLEMAGLYFEIAGENLTRFNENDSIYTIPSILESKSMLGNFDLLTTLKENFQSIWIKPKLIDYMYQQFAQHNSIGFDLVDLKNGAGGIRHLQTALWSILISQQLTRGDTRYLLTQCKKQKFINDLDIEHVLTALQFYLELRNFKILVGNKLDKGATDDFLDEKTIQAYLALSDRFENIDQFDQKLIFCIQSIKSLADNVTEYIRSLNYTESFKRLIIEKQYFSHQITRYWSVEQKERLSWLIKPQLKQKNSKEPLFSEPIELIDLVLNIAQTGAKLSHRLKKKLAGNFSQLEQLVACFENETLARFIRQLFVAPHTSRAIHQLWDVMDIDPKSEKIKTLLGLFIPECDQMRFLRRNTEIHEFPLCVHSIKTLKKVEAELVHIRKEEPEILDFIDENSIFALKWSCLFHDIGKIDMKLDHEKSGPEMAIRILQRHGKGQSFRVLGLIRLLVEHHQSIVKFSRLSMYPEIGINKYLDLAERDPRKVLLLYLINVSDYKSVNRLFKTKTGAIESLFKKTMEIFNQLKKKDTDKTVTKAVNAFLGEKINLAKKNVANMSLLQRCIIEDVQQVIFDPLMSVLDGSQKKLLEKANDLKKLIGLYSQCFEDIEAKKTILIEFSNIIDKNISLENKDVLIKTHFPNWDWFFNTIPNRLILNLTNEELSYQLSKFAFDGSKSFEISVIRGDTGEYDSLLFWASDLTFQKKLAFILNRKNINIESGKTNHIQYRSGKSGIVGFFHISQFGKLDFSESDMEASVSNLTIPKPRRKKALEKDRMIHVSHYQEDQKAYIVKEVADNVYSRESGLFHYIKVSTSDQRYRFFKILKTMEDIGIVVKQSTITTIGNQINDYFVFDEIDIQSLDIELLKKKLEENLKLNYK